MYSYKQKEYSAIGYYNDNKKNSDIHTNIVIPQIRKMSGKRCSFCQRVTDDKNLTIEHIKPRCRFPEEASSYNNLLLACKTCNGAKGNVWDNDILYVAPNLVDELHLKVVVDFQGRLIAADKNDLKFCNYLKKFIDIYELNSEKLCSSRKNFNRTKKYLDPISLLESDLDNQNVQFPSIILNELITSQNERVEQLKEQFYDRDC